MVTKRVVDVEIVAVAGTWWRFTGGDRIAGGRGNPVWGNGSLVVELLFPHFEAARAGLWSLLGRADEPITPRRIQLGPALQPVRLTAIAADLLSDHGLSCFGLPVTFPFRDGGARVREAVCRRAAAHASELGLDGLLVRSWSGSSSTEFVRLTARPMLRPAAAPLPFATWWRAGSDTLDSGGIA